MKKIIFLISVIASLTSFAGNGLPEFNKHADYAPVTLFEDCDACGCSANGGSMGFSSIMNANFIGVRYLHQQYKSRDGVFNNSPWIDENFNTAQVWARIPISKKIEIMALLPYHFHNRIKPDGAKQNISGLGDITFMGFYTLFETSADSSSFSHKVQLGTGIKMPTGNYDKANNGSINPSFQVGTGSWDYTVAAEYILKKARIGFHGAANYIFKTENEKHYRFGDQFNYAGTFFYDTNVGALSVMPQLGFAGEVYRANHDFGEAVPLTEGNVLFSKAGIELGYNKFSLGINVMLPLQQNLTGGRVEAKYRFSVNLNYTI